jgi:hypothetical protein
MKSAFSTLDIVKAFPKIQRERLRDWMNRGFIKPSVSANGQGTKASFTLQDVYGIALFQSLIDAGFNRSVASSFVKGFMMEEKNALEGGKTAYIRFKVEDEGKMIRVQTLVDEEWKLDYQTGVTEMGTIKMKLLSRSPRYKDIANRNWNIIHIVNFKNLCHEVDLALSKL